MAYVDTPDSASTPAVDEEAKLPAETPTKNDSEGSSISEHTPAPAAAAATPLTFPEGGLRGWLTVAGGYVNHD